MKGRWLFVLLFLSFASNADDGKIDSLNLLGEKLVEAGQLDKALDVYDQGMARSREINDITALAVFQNNKGIVLMQQGHNMEALGQFLQSRIYSEQSGDDETLGYSYLNAGIIYYDLGIYETAMKELLDAAKIFEKSDDDDIREALASAYNTLGNVNRRLKNYRYSFIMFNRSLKELEQLDKQEDVASALNNIGELYKEMTRYDSAVIYFNAALSYKRHLNDTGRIAISLSELGDTYRLWKDYPKARQYITAAYQMRRSVGDIELGASCNQMAQLCIESGQVLTAIDYLRQGRPLLISAGRNEDLIENYRLSSYASEYAGRLADALAFDRSHDKLKDSVDNSLDGTAEMAILYEVGKSEQRAALQSKEYELSRIKEKRLLYLISVAAAFLLIITVWASWAYKRKKREKENTETLMRELNHRVKNNLQVLSGLMRLQYDQLSDTSAKNAVRENLSRISAMSVIHQRLYKGKMLTVVSIDDFMRVLVKELVSTFGVDTDKARIECDFDKLDAVMDKAIPMGLIVNELVTNVFKYAFAGNPDPLLRLEISRFGEKGVLIIVSDNGPGINDESLLTGSFGFKLVKLLCKQLSARMIVKSDAGLQVRIEIPQV